MLRTIFVATVKMVGEFAHCSRRLLNQRFLREAVGRIAGSGIIIPMFLLCLWWFGARYGWWSAYLLPGPEVVFRSFFSLVKSGELTGNIMASMSRILKGFCAASVIALASAFLCGVYNPALRQLSPMLEFLRHIPPMATIPMLILWFGIGETSKLVIIVMATFFPIFLNTVQGISQCDRGLLEVAMSFGYTRAQTLRHVVYPSSLPYILTGMRLGLGYSWRSLIAAELVAASSGLGYMIIDAEQLSRPDVILVGILVIGCLGSVMDFSLSRLTNRFTAYKNTADGVV
ncbi:MAG: ABC transporter permease [Synergistaceae bacterium]|jgi:sulfonate transport system permease protein|nr:ABC transporter permease [Synergistaceae bacterium]